MWPIIFILMNTPVFLLPRLSFLIRNASLLTCEKLQEVALLFTCNTANWTAIFKLWIVYWISQKLTFKTIGLALTFIFNPPLFRHTWNILNPIWRHLISLMYQVHTISYHIIIWWFTDHIQVWILLSVNNFTVMSYVLSYLMINVIMMHCFTCTNKLTIYVSCAIRQRRRVYKLTVNLCFLGRKTWRRVYKLSIYVSCAVRQERRVCKLEMERVFASASADASDETSALTFASALWVLLIFASAPCRDGCADCWVSSLYDTKRKRLSPEKAEKLLFLKKKLPILNFKYELT